MTQYSGVYSLQTQGQAITSGQWATDPYYKNTTLLLHADGVPSNSQNNTFLDSSSYSLSITRAGNTTQGAFSPYMPNGYWGVYFDGVSNTSLSVANNAALKFGTSPMCIEAWVYPTANPANSWGPIINDWTTGASPGPSNWTLAYDGTNIVFEAIGAGNSYWDQGGGTVYVSTSLSQNVWTHIAVSYDGTNIRLFKNGALIQTAAYAGFSTNAGSYSANIGIGDALGFSGYSYIGYISNLRVVKGSSVYTSAFTPSTTPLTAITNTSLLTCQSNSFIDNSSNNFALTVNGSPSVQQFQPFMRPYQYSASVIGGSGYFDGTGDYLSTPDNTVFDLGSSSFTMECWIYPTAASSVAGQTIFGKRATSGTIGGVLLGFWGSTFYPSFYATFDGSTWGINNVTSSIACKPYAWNHVALTRNGSTWTIWVNGQSGNTTTNAGTVYYNTSNFTVGATSADGSDVICSSYITDARIIKGTAVYTGAFTPPTLAPLATSGSASAASYSSTTNVNTSFSASATSLLCSMKNAGIYDSAMMNNLETVGDAKVSTNVVKYGSGSMYFDGTGDYLTVPFGQGLNLSSGDWTIECWVYCTALTATYQVILSKDGIASTSYPQYTLMISSAGVFAVELGNGNGLSPSSTVYSGIAVALNTWTHLAAVRTGSVINLFQNGIKTNSSTIVTAMIDGGKPLTIGYRPSEASTWAYNGYLDDVRITKGVARYTTNFQPPKVAFANQ